MKENEYKCAECHKVFEKDWSDEEAIRESREKFGPVAPTELEVVCGDCYKKLFGEGE